MQKETCFVLVETIISTSFNGCHSKTFLMKQAASSWKCIHSLVLYCIGIKHIKVRMIKLLTNWSYCCNHQKENEIQKCVPFKTSFKMLLYFFSFCLKLRNPGLTKTVVRPMSPKPFPSPDTFRKFGVRQSARQNK